jgi:hypothetical protein
MMDGPLVALHCVANMQPFQQITDVLAVFGERCRATAQSFEGLRRRIPLVQVYKLAPERRRPKRIAKKINARFGAAHQRDYVYAMVDHLLRRTNP